MVENKRRGARLLAVWPAVIAMALTVGCQSGEGPPVAAEPEESVITVNYGHGLPTLNASFVNLAVAETLGFFEREGLDVNIQTTDASAAVMQSLISGQFDIGTLGPEVVASAIGDGHELVLVYNLVRGPVGKLVVPEDSDVRDLADFAGKQIGVVSLASSNIQLTNGMLANAGVSPDKVEYLAVGTGAQALHALNTGEVSALAMADSLIMAMENLGAEFTYFEPDPNLMATQIAASRKTVEENPELIARFGRAIAQATHFVELNPERAVREMWKAFPDTRIAGTSEEEQLRTDLNIVEARWPALLSGLPADEMAWGSYTEESVQTWLDFAITWEVIKKPVDSAVLYTNEFVDEYNDWAPADVLKISEGG